MRTLDAVMFLAIVVGSAPALSEEVPFLWEGTLTLTPGAQPASADYSDGSIDFTLYHPVCPLVQTCIATGGAVVDVPVVVAGTVDKDALFVRDVQIEVASDPPLAVAPFGVTTPDLGPVIVLVDPPGFDPPMNVQIYDSFFVSIDVLEASTTIDPAPADFPIDPGSLTASTVIGSTVLSIDLGLAPDGVPLIPLPREVATPIRLRLDFAQPSAALEALSIESTALIEYGDELAGYDPVVLDHFRAQDPDLPTHWANRAVDVPGLSTFFWNPSSGSVRLRSAVQVPEPRTQAIASLALALLGAARRARDGDGFGSRQSAKDRT